MSFGRTITSAGLAGWLGLCLGWIPTGFAAGSEPAASAQPPRIFPDYTDTVIPPNIAPLNFRIEEPGARYKVRIDSASGEPILLTSREPSIEIPPKPWANLLRANAGQNLLLHVSRQDGRGQWREFRAITNRIAREELDGYLVYRLLKPIYNIYNEVGIYQRNLQTFEQDPLLQNKAFARGGNWKAGYGRGCLNCHTFLNQNPNTFALHIRSDGKFKPMLLVRSNAVARVDKTFGYLSWHPSGRLLAFSANQMGQFFHTTGETRDVFNAVSDVGVYRVDSNTLVTPSCLAQPELNETWPAWSPDGRFLYFCRAPKLPPGEFASARYDLVRVSYEIESDKWGEPETLVAAANAGMSACEPKVSPDGKWLLFCLCNYGSFPIYQSSSDLYVMDLGTLKYRRLAINSDECDSWHCWSSNSRWVVFSSKRINGLFARPYFSYVDAEGQFHKPFLLPQEDANFYDFCLQTFNVPELIRGPVEVSQDEVSRGVVNPRKVLSPTGRAKPQQREQ